MRRFILVSEAEVLIKALIVVISIVYSLNRQEIASSFRQNYSTNKASMLYSYENIFLLKIF